MKNRLNSRDRFGIHNCQFAILSHFPFDFRFRLITFCAAFDVPIGRALAGESNRCFSVSAVGRCNFLSPTATAKSFSSALTRLESTFACCFWRGDNETSACAKANKN
jgi:hypothetical protein